MEKTKEKKQRKVKPGSEKEVALEVVPVQFEQPVVPRDFKITSYTKSQVDLIKRTIAVGATDDELKMFLYVCRQTGLDPFSKQIYFVKRWDSKSGTEKGAIQVGIDGLRSTAEKTGSYAGNDDPIFDDESKPQKATVTVYKMIDHQRVAFTASARWKQYYPGDKQGFMWNKMPHVMLGKCAEALALRKAFPMVMSGLYTPEEMEQSKQINAARPEAKAEDAFAKAKEVIGKQTNITTLLEFIKKVQGSKLYDDAQKKTLVEACEKRIKEIREGEVEEDQPDDPATAALLDAIKGGKE